MELHAPDPSAFILAGGKSTRMGTDKAFIILDGRTLLARMLDLARQVTSNVYIVGDAAKFASFAPTVEDLFSGCGPLGGIHAALRSSKTELNLMLAVDVPFATPSLLHFLLMQARNSPAAAVTVPSTTQGWQPLCAIYRREFADAAENALRQGRHKIDLLFDQARTRVITEQDLQSAGFSSYVFRNLNTPEDLAEVRE